MRFWLGLALSSFLEIPITFYLKIHQFLAWAGLEQFPWNSNYILIENWWDSGLGWPWAVSLKFLLHFNWKLMRFWLGLALSSFLEIPITFWLKIDEILAWAGPKHFPLNSDYILIWNSWDSGLGWPWAFSFNKRVCPWLPPWAFSFKCELHLNWKLMRFWLGLALNIFL